MFSHEILTESAEGNQLRNWYILPYLELPQEDPDFSAYFTNRWTDSLRNTLVNFLSLVLSCSPPPKLLILERWFRSEEQLRTRTQLNESFTKLDILIKRLEKNEERLVALREVVRDLLVNVVKSSLSGPGTARGSAVALFEDNDKAEATRQQVKDLGHSVSKLAVECCNRSRAAQNTSSSDDKLRDILGPFANAYFNTGSSETNNSNNPLANADDQQSSVEVLEATLVQQVNSWLEKLTK